MFIQKIYQKIEKKKMDLYKNYSKNKIFLEKGLTDEWKTELDKNLIKKIETNLENEMKELNYL